MSEKLKNKTIASITLGCKVNAYDTMAMVEILVNHGCSVVDFDKKADIYIINTCTVTNIGDKKSRQAIAKAYKQNPRAVIVACGCYTQVEPHIVEAINGVSLIIGTKDRMRIAEFIIRHLEGESENNFVSSIKNQKEFEDLNAANFNEKTRAYLKIQEGCDRYCSYCIIPLARGPLRSRPPESVLKEARKLSQAGYKEIVLTGIQISAYGKDINQTSLAQILAQVHTIEKIKRIRLSSIEPNIITDDFIDSIAPLNKICHHFHLSLQSGSDKILAAMNRRYSSQDYVMAVEKIRKIMPHAGITTDIIVGFPGEEDEDFNDTLEFVKRLKLSKIHVFPFSPKNGTKAALMENQISPQIKKARAQILSNTAEKLSEEFAHGFINKNLDVLFEKNIGNNIYEGHSDNYITVRKQSHSPLEEKILSVQISHGQKDVLYAL